ncbi:hypothetical protein LX32DRAFT_643113 [Colletotrichum zoysiae]|uniref:Uncharacterized protein n=1 Tax=Colletotrichum zoysiae TaxID=1216348 RepID=A0AAD9HB13_9PEZI|nr:hypothetical protein LX32DRAFT_643113 [Colletotrichum zoysiae]
MYVASKLDWNPPGPPWLGWLTSAPAQCLPCKGRVYLEMLPTPTRLPTYLPTRVLSRLRAREACIGPLYPYLMPVPFLVSSPRDR